MAEVNVDDSGIDADRRASTEVCKRAGRIARF